MKASSHGITLKAVHQPEHNCNGCHFDFPDRCAKANPSTRTMDDLAEAVKSAEFLANTSCNTHPIIWLRVNDNLQDLTATENLSKGNKHEA